MPSSCTRNPDCDDSQWMPDCRASVSGRFGVKQKLAGGAGDFVAGKSNAATDADADGHPVYAIQHLKQHTSRMSHH